MPLYGNLLELLARTECRQSHRLDSVKLLRDGCEHEPDGAIDLSTWTGRRDYFKGPSSSKLD